MITVRNSRNVPFCRAVDIAVQFDDWKHLQVCYNVEDFDKETKKYLLFFLEHLYRNDQIGLGGYYGNV